MRREIAVEPYARPLPLRSRSIDVVSRASSSNLLSRRWNLRATAKATDLGRPAQGKQGRGGEARRWKVADGEDKQRKGGQAGAGEGQRKTARDGPAGEPLSVIACGGCLVGAGLSVGLEGDRDRDERS